MWCSCTSAMADIPATDDWLGYCTGGWLSYCYSERLPLCLVWQRLSDARRPVALAHWLHFAERDPWVFQQLLELAAAIFEAGEEMPARLAAFMTEYLRGERAAPKGSRSDPTRDIRIAAMVESAAELGVSKRAACRFIAEGLNLSYEAVESARRRGERMFKEARRNIHTASE